MSLFTINLNEDEELLTIVRRHWITFLGTIFKFLIIIAVIFAFNKFIPGEEWKKAVIIAALFFAFLFLVYKFIMWFLVSLVITDQKIIDINQKSLNKRVVTEVLVSDVSKVACFKEGFLQNLMNYGTLVIDIKGGGKIAGFGVKKPEFLISNINKLKRDFEYESQKEKRKREL